MSSSRDLIKNLAIEAGIDLQKDIIIRNNDFYDRVFSDESLGLGETFMMGWWDSKDKTLDEIFYLISKADLKKKLNELSIESKMAIGISWLYNYVFPTSSIENSKIVAVRHYNLNKKIYKSMLGNKLVYSCGYFVNKSDTIDQAQNNKMELIRKKIHLKPGMRVLDIGCGWGVLADFLANSENNIYVDAITISTEQYAYAKKHYESSHIKFYLQDYREFNPGYKYDAIVSVGMFEHVNSNNYEKFMSITNDLLKDNGIFLLHTIGSPQEVIVPDRWIEKYIFPNSQLPTLTQISSSAEGKFIIEDIHNFGSHYDKTLMHWYNNFTRNFVDLNKSLNGTLTLEFYRMWIYYLLSCAGGFRSRHIQLYQVVLTKNPTGHYQREFL